jgi:hypothetical protein
MQMARKTSQTINFNALAKRQNEIVHEHATTSFGNFQSPNIFYKLPHQGWDLALQCVLRHFKTLRLLDVLL